MTLEWMDDALCAEVGTEPFFPERGEVPTQALAVCRQCPVQVECLAHARHLETFGSWSVTGVWGGTTGKARRTA